MIPVRILGTASVLPGRCVPTREVALRAYPDADPAVLEAKTGIHTRYWAEPGATHAAVAAETVRRALARAGMAPEELRRIILATSGAGDYLVPATSNAVAWALGLHGSCDCFDLNNTCMGFLSAFDVAARSVATGIFPVAVVATDLCSWYLAPENPRTYAVFGDASAAVILGPGRPGEGIVASWLANDGSLHGTVTLAHGRSGQPHPTITFGATNREIAKLALDSLAQGVERVLTEAGLTLDDVRWVLPHQPNGLIFQQISDRLGIPFERMVPVVGEIGSVSCVSIAVTLDRLVSSGRLAPGDLLLLAGVGGGISYGAVLLRVGG